MRTFLILASLFSLAIALYALTEKNVANGLPPVVGVSPDHTSDSKETPNLVTSVETHSAPAECRGASEVLQIPAPLAVETQCACRDCLRGLSEEPLAYFIWKDSMAERFTKEQALQVSYGRAVAFKYLEENAVKFALTDEQLVSLKSQFDHRKGIDNISSQDERLIAYGKASVSHDLRKNSQVILTKSQLEQIEEEFDLRAAKRRRGEKVLPECCEKGTCPSCK